MDFILEFIFEFFAEILGNIIESDRVPKAIRYFLFALILVPPLVLLGFSLYHATNAYLTVFLIILTIGLLAAFIFFIYKTNKSGMLKVATKADLPQILKLYRSVIGKSGCTWDEFYPNETTLQEDFNAKQLYVLFKGKRMIGAASIVPENELDDLDCWYFKENAKEIARIVIAPEYQGKGYGKHLVNKLCLKMERTDCKAVHILVAKENHHALNLYRETGFQNKGHCHRYDLDFYAYEKEL